MEETSDSNSVVRLQKELLSPEKPAPYDRDPNKPPSEWLRQQQALKRIISEGGADERQTRQKRDKK